MAEVAENETQNLSLQNGERCRYLMPQFHHLCSAEVRLSITKVWARRLYGAT